MDKKTLTYYGSCVVSNIFSQARDQNCLNFTLSNRFFQINPISLVKSEPLDFLYAFNPAGRFNTAISSIKNDIQKDVFLFMKEKKTNFFIIEQVSLLYDLLQIEYEDKRYLLTWMYEIEKFNSEVLYQMLDEIGAKYRKVNSMEYENEIESVMEAFCAHLLEIFKPEQIIFVEVVPARLCVRKNGLVDYVGKENIDTYLAYMRHMSEAFLSQVEGCHIIRALEPMIASWKNVFGISAVHFDSCYYEYAYKAVEVVTAGVKREEELEKLRKLYVVYSEKMREIERMAVNRLLSAYRKQRIESSYDHWRVAAIQDKRISFLEAVAQVQYMPHKERMYFEGNLNEYIKNCIQQKTSRVFFLSISDSGAKYWKLFTERRSLGLRDEIGFRTSYVAVYDTDSGICTEKYYASNQEILYHCDIITRNPDVIVSSGLKQEIKYFNVLVSSKAWEWNKQTGEYKSWARILINNVDYSKNKTGLNVVVFNKTEGGGWKIAFM